MTDLSKRLTEAFKDEDVIKVVQVSVSETCVIVRTLRRLSLKELTEVALSANATVEVTHGGDHLTFRFQTTEEPMHELTFKPYVEPGSDDMDGIEKDDYDLGVHSTYDADKNMWHVQGTMPQLLRFIGQLDLTDYEIKEIEL